MDNNQDKWTEVDFEELSWHDCQINSIALDQDGEFQSDLVLDLDFIVEWLCDADRTCRFLIAPAVLRFAEVNDLRLEIFLTFKQPLEIKSIERSELPNGRFKCFHWIIRVQNFPGAKDNQIEFDATGFVLELTGDTLKTNAQSLTAEQRRQLKTGRTGT